MTLQRLSVAALAGLTAVSSAPPVTAHPQVRIGDGRPTPDACAELGYRLSERRGPMGIPGGITSRVAPYAPPPPPSASQRRESVPTIPPLPVPPVEHRLQDSAAAAAAPPGSVSEMVVASGRYKRYPSQPLDTERYPNAQ